jgi:hypothetical protein
MKTRLPGFYWVKASFISRGQKWVPVEWITETVQGPVAEPFWNWSRGAVGDNSLTEIGPMINPPN